MKTVVLLVALGLAAAAAATVPVEKEGVKAVVEPLAALPADLALKVDQVKDMMTKGFFEDLAQVSQNIIQHAHMVAEQIIKNIDEVAQQALMNLQKDRPESITLHPDPVVTPSVNPDAKPAIRAPAAVSS